MNRSLTLQALLDENLRLLSFNAPDAELDELADRVLATPVTILPSLERERQLVSQLAAHLQPTLGAVIQLAISSQQMTAAQLAAEIRLPTSLLENLLNDALFVSNVPVVLMRNLLRRLAISFESAQTAIHQTVLLLRHRASEGDISLSPSLAFRRESTEGSLGTPRQEGKLLFENDDALSMYMNRLDELMQA